MREEPVRERFDRVGAQIPHLMGESLSCSDGLVIIQRQTRWDWITVTSSFSSCAENLLQSLLHSDTLTPDPSAH